MSKEQIIGVHTSLPSHRRAGISFGRGYTLIPAGQISDKVMGALKADPHLKLSLLDEEEAAERVRLGNARRVNLKPTARTRAASNTDIDPEKVKAAVASLGLKEGQSPSAKAVNEVLKKSGEKFTVKVADIEAALSVSAQ